ncbi:ankyrin repeat-containing protein [Chlorella sorokiniana]|uniref:Ankyrin repeat-containing protein n=1 Tax=Chlorella sorokiniana TaxID=3076 RepID=A0A2P6TJD7_CHLSO|nr:ankyrin repeat-containing protein [Chlorella sorokiniana]|eukprot:PRW39366.1 ankyrin repeat-containing protein [Chlorella sorokiniana]
MNCQGWMRNVDGHGGQVVFSFGGQVYTVQLPPVGHDPDSTLARTLVREEATTVLQCFSARAALELQRALVAIGAAGAARLDVPPMQLHGSFADLAQQLQECVHSARAEGEWLESSTGLLNAAVRLGHLSAAQQLMRIDLEAAFSQPAAANHPAHLAAMQPDGIAALKLLLAAAPELVHSTCQHAHSMSIDVFDGWTLLHSAASSGNIDAIRLLLQLAPQLANTSTSANEFPLHQTATRSLQLEVPTHLVWQVLALSLANV